MKKKLQVLPELRLPPLIPAPTIMGSCFILLSFMLYLVSMQSYSGLLLLILGILFGVYVINLVEAYRSCRALHFKPPSDLTCTEGEKLKDTWEISNESTHAAGNATVFSSFGEILRVGPIAPEETVHVTPELSLARRGVFPFRRLNVESTFPFGLIRASRRLPVDGEIVVYPAPYRCESPPAAGFEPMVGGKFKGKNRSSAGDHFHGVRPHQPQDPMKMIHWKSSSKGLGIMVKEFDEELSGRIALIVDPTPGKAPDGESLLDWSARAAASLMLAALDEGHQVEFIRLGDAQTQPVPPFADGDVVLDLLARMQPNSKARNQDLLDGAVNRVPPRASICLVLTGLNDAVRELIEARLLPRRRKVAVYLPETCRPAAKDLPVPVRFFRAREMVQEEQP